MAIQIGIRDLVRDSSILQGHDYVEVMDKRKNEFKGLFVSAAYADEFKKFLDKKIMKKHLEKLNRIKKYTGSGSIDKSFDNLTTSEIKSKIARKKYDKK